MTVTVENMKSNTTHRGDNELPLLAAQINKAHTQAATASKRALQHALEAGEALTATRQKIEHGWLAWLKENCRKVPHQRAYEYMRLWEHRDTIGQIADIGNVGLVAALKAISKKLPKDKPNKIEFDADIEAEAKAEADITSISLEEWKELSSDERREYLQPHNFPGKARFNPQTSTGIEWAQWSWNPVTGCLHECPYCYARDITQHFSHAFPFGFAPAFKPDALNAPAKMQVPAEAETDTRFRNVFTCSMSDLFGRWVPKEWIIAVLEQVRANPQWNFLFLTKFPKRMAEFDIPANAWMGTTVDLQARVANAEAAFERLKDHGGVRWLSVEPLIEPLKFKRLDLFHWIVIGGASASTQTPEWRPPVDWINDLHVQAREANVAIYEKDNLYGNRTLELPFKAPIKSDPTEAPSAFHYLRKDALEK